MKYKYSPILKYIALFIAIFMFIKHTKKLTNNNNFLMSISILTMIIVFDYVLIDKHPNLLMDTDEENVEKFEENAISNEDIQQILDNYDPTDDINDLNDDDDLDHYPENPSFYQMPTDFKKQSYDLDVDCYRRGDGRGNNKKVQRYYETNVL